MENVNKQQLYLVILKRDHIIDIKVRFDKIKFVK